MSRTRTTADKSWPRATTTAITLRFLGLRAVVAKSFAPDPLA
ncbi:hypothetical protein [Lentzea albidocapillata]|nr:hypothetical protein [Lentzea albidocapillata]